MYSNPQKGTRQNIVICRYVGRIWLFYPFWGFVWTKTFERSDQIHVGSLPGRGESAYHTQTYVTYGGFPNYGYSNSWMVFIIGWFGVPFYEPLVIKSGNGKSLYMEVSGWEKYLYGWFSIATFDYRRVLWTWIKRINSQFIHMWESPNIVSSCDFL